MADMKQSQRELAQFSSNLKSTALGVKFTKKLFTDPLSLDPKSILTTLKALGLNIPDEVQIAADVAQVIVAGQAVMTAYQTGKNINDIRSATNTTAAAVRAVNMIAEKKGWIDDDTASLVAIGVDVALIVASMGTDVNAWISLSLDLAQANASKQGEADQRAIADAAAQYRARVSPQAAILASSFKDFQEGRIGIYGLIAKMAVETPDLWPQVMTEDSPFKKLFPDLQMLPTVNDVIFGHGETEIWGNWPWPARGRYVIDRWTADFPISVKTLATDFTKETAAQYFFEILLKPWLAVYGFANHEIVDRGNMSMANIAALSYLINPDGEISDTDDYVSFLIGSNLTPYDFGNDMILDQIADRFVEEAYAGTQHTFQESAVSVGKNSANKGFELYTKDVEAMYARLKLVKQTDDIRTLTQFPYIYKKLQAYMDFQPTSFEKDPGLGMKLNEKFPEKSVRAWRKLHNYIAVLQMLDTFRTDSYLKNTQYAEQLLPFMPSIDSFSQNIQRLNYLSTMRSVNVQATARIAELLGVKPSQLVKVTDDSFQGPAKFTTKP